MICIYAIFWFLSRFVFKFLNKRDIFQEKIRKIPLTVACPDYNGAQFSYEESIAYLTEQFEAISRNRSRSCYTYVTCATETNEIRTIFNEISEDVIKTALDQNRKV